MAWAEEKMIPAQSGEKKFLRDAERPKKKIHRIFITQGNNFSNLELPSF